MDRRGTSYERINEWELAENDLLMSLKLSPDQPYVMNYLAYSWVEQGKNIDEALEMLKKANGSRTVPQIFIGEYHVGGNHELQTLVREGKLNSLLGI